MNEFFFSQMLHLCNKTPKELSHSITASGRLTRILSGNQLATWQENQHIHVNVGPSPIEDKQRNMMISLGEERRGVIRFYDSDLGLGGYKGLSLKVSLYTNRDPF